MLAASANHFKGFGVRTPGTFKGLAFPRLAKVISDGFGFRLAKYVSQITGFPRMASCFPNGFGVSAHGVSQIVWCFRAWQSFRMVWN